MKILVAEDEFDLREIIVEELKLRGHEVLEADCGPKAIEILTRESVDLVISDIRMPGFGGVELVRRCRESTTAGLPTEFIFMSGYSDVPVDSASEVGVRAVFQKPFRLRDISACVATIAETREAKLKRTG